MYILLLVNFPVVSGGFALLAVTGATLAGVGGAAGVGAVGVVTTGLMAVGTMGLFGVWFFHEVFKAIYT